MDNDIIKRLIMDNVELSKNQNQDLIDSINQFNIINSQLYDIKKKMLYIKRQKQKMRFEYKIKLFIYNINKIFRKAR